MTTTSGWPGPTSWPPIGAVFLEDNRFGCLKVRGVLDNEHIVTAPLVKAP
jgi:hypothetical protein